MEKRRITGNLFKVLLPLLLGSAILYWMYRDFDFKGMSHVLLHDMNWTWMLLSFPFGILAQTFRARRWRQVLEPLNERPRLFTCFHSIFISYASSLVIPRVGEFARCGVLKRYEGVSFSKALGTVVTERAFDSLLVLFFAGITILFQLSTFGTFFEKTGTSISGILSGFSLTGYFVTAVCAAAILLLLHWLFKSLSIYNKVKTTFSGIWQGVISMKNVKNVPLFIFYSLAIWACYFLHYYLTFFCFDFTADLGIGCAVVTFIVGTIAVIVPTPNGAGPWHFAVKTMLILYGVAEPQALYFVLIVHTVQTLLVVALGVFSVSALFFTKREDLEERGERREERD